VGWIGLDWAGLGWLDWAGWIGLAGLGDHVGWIGRPCGLDWVNRWAGLGEDVGWIGLARFGGVTTHCWVAANAITPAIRA
jgi:hypothetical protein